MSGSKKVRINALLTALNQDILEKEEIISLVFISAIAGESIFLLGKPGVAKSLIARRLKNIFKEAKSFEYLMNRFSTPEEIFGPISIAKLKSEDKYERIVKNYLPDANVVFLDEIWKAGPSIQNTLLTVLNEKLFRNGEQELKVNLYSLIAASNELPEEGQGLEALWDRFIIRVPVQGIVNEDNFRNMIGQTASLDIDNIAESIKLSNEEYEQWSNEIDQVKVTDFSYEVISNIRKAIEAEEKAKKLENIYISDRRWRKIIRLLRTSAFLNGRNTVTETDLFLIKYCIWDNMEDFPKLNKIVQQNISLTSLMRYSSFSELQIEYNNLVSTVKKMTEHVVVDQKEEAILKNNMFIFNRQGAQIFIKPLSWTKLSLTTFTNTVAQTLTNGKWSNLHFSMKRAEGDFKFVINGEEPYKLSTRIAKKHVTKTKQAAPELISIWDIKCQELSLAALEQKKILNKNMLPNILNFNNINQEAKLTEEIGARFDRMVNGIEKLRHFYKNTKDGTSQLLQPAMFII